MVQEWDHLDCWKTMEQHGKVIFYFSPKSSQDGSNQASNEQKSVDCQTTLCSFQRKSSILHVKSVFAHNFLTKRVRAF